MVKEKPVAPRMYDADGFKKRAACICVRTQAQTEVLLVTSSRMPERWIVPGGSVEPEEDSSMAAMREVEEEAGVRGQLDGMVGVFEDKERKTRTSVYALNVTEELPEWEDSQRIGRRRKWFGVEEAAELLAAYKPIERTYLQMYQESRRESGTASRTDEDDEDDDCEDADVANNSNSISGLNLIRDENARTANNASKLRRRRLKKAPLSSSDVGVVLVASSDSIDASRDDDDDDDDAEEEDGGDRDDDRDADKEPDAEKRGGGKQEPRLCPPDVRQ